MTNVLSHHIPGLLALDRVGPGLREEMFTLLSRHFNGVSWEQFAADLSEKNWVIEIRRGAELLGFSTLLGCEMELDGRSITAIYSGDTIVAPEARNSPALARTWIAAVNYIRASSPGRPCYWLLLTSGFRTYRFLPVFWREFFPNYKAQTPSSMQGILHQLAITRYGDWYDRSSGIVRFPRPQILRDSPETTRAADPHVAFFLNRNPGHDRGDELACLTEISEANLTRAGRRMVATG